MIKKLILMVLVFCLILSPVLGATVSWSTGSEWDNAVSQSNIVHESVANTDHNNEDDLKKSYSAENPYMNSYLNNYWAFDENSGGTAVDISGASGELNGIDIGYDSGNLDFHANQWNGGSDQGEIDITCSGGDSNCEFTRSGTTYSGGEVQDVNWGVATDGQDKGTQYIMYSAESVHTRFSNAHNSNADHFIGVNYDDGWEYDGNNNDGDTSFSPQSSDILVAEYNGEASADSGNEGDISYVSKITGNNGATSGGVTQGEQGILGTSSYGFDGSNDVSVNVSHTSTLNDIGTSQYTVSAWVNLDSYVSSGTVLVGKTSNELFMNTEIQDGGSIRVGHEECDDTDYYASGGDVGTGNWVMITAVKTDSEYIAYKNGQNVFSYSYGGNPCDTNADLTIGGGSFNDNQRPADGNIDDVRIYDSALSQQEVADLYNIYADESSLTTLSKTFSEPRDMESLQLTNLDYSLNGEQIEIVVETNQGEKSNPVTLDGSSSYDVTGLSTEADTFNLEININSNDVTSTPVVRSIGLSGDEANDSPNVNGPVNPTDNEDSMALDPNLEVDVNDPDGDGMDVIFYEGSPGSNQIGNVSASNTENAVLDTSGLDIGSETGTEYNWSVRVSDGRETVDSGTWSFITESEPEIDEASAGPQGGEVTSTNPELSVDVSHPDGRTMDVTFFLNGEAFPTDQQVDGSGTASIQTDELDADTVYDWSVVVDDGNGYTVDNQASPWSFETDTGEPDISIDYGDGVNFGPDRAVLDVVPGHSHASTVDYVRLLDADDNVVDEVEDVAVDSPVSLLWEDLEQDQSYNWRAEIEHAGESDQTSLASFTTLTVGVNLTDTVENADAYSIYRRTGTSSDEASFDYGNGDYAFIGSGNTLELVDDSSDLESGNSYCYVATAHNVGGESPGSDEECTDGEVQLNP